MQVRLPDGSMAKIAPNEELADDLEFTHVLVDWADMMVADPAWVVDVFRRLTVATSQLDVTLH
jgi:hypothetical protein